MKKIINKPMDVVGEALRGMELRHPELLYTPGYEVISRREKADKVAVISGSGAGHHQPRRICGKRHAGCSRIRECVFLTQSGPDRRCHQPDEYRKRRSSDY